MKNIYGLFKKEENLAGAVEELDEKGFAEQVSLAMRSSAKEEELEKLKGDSAAAAAIMGGTLGGVLGSLSSLYPVLLPGWGSFLIAGPLTAVWGVTGAALGALAGGLITALMDTGMTQAQAELYEMRLKKGDSLIMVSTEKEKIVKEILEKYGAEEIYALS